MNWIPSIDLFMARTTSLDQRKWFSQHFECRKQSHIGKFVSQSKVKILVNLTSIEISNVCLILYVATWICYNIPYYISMGTRISFHFHYYFAKKKRIHRSPMSFDRLETWDRFHTHLQMKPTQANDLF